MKNVKAGLTEPWIKLAGSIGQEDYVLLCELYKVCIQYEQIALKLELEYKRESANIKTQEQDQFDVNEFLYFDGKQLIGYFGICSFGGTASPLEITGMVHPDYRRRGIASKLYELVFAECKRRKAGEILGLSDKKSISGQKFLEKIKAEYRYSEYEMYLREENRKQDEKQDENLSYDIQLRKATNEDAYEVAYQNSIYFNDPLEQGEENETEIQKMMLPEEEEKCGMTIYLALKDHSVIGKVHLQSVNGVGGIYGLGVLPENRGKGYGREILVQSIIELKQRNVEEIMLQVATENEKALNLYQSCGFQETSVMEYFNLRLENETTF